jgi:flagellar hook-associated protein 3 FlgL
MVQSINRSRPPTDVSQQLSLSRQIAQQQLAISTGKRVETASDDPQGWVDIANISRLQANEAAWTANISRASTRASQADASLTAISDGLTRVRELLIQASTGAATQQDREGLALEVEGIMATFEDILAQKDNFGGDLFRDGQPIRVPIGNARYVVAAPSLGEVTQNITVPATGVTTDLQQIMADISTAIRTGTDVDRSNELRSVSAAVDHVTSLLTKQGVARSALETTTDQLNESRLSLIERRSEVEDLDVTEAITSLQSLLTSLEAAQAVYSRVSQRTLFDFLR